MRKRFHPATKAVQLTAVLYALSDPVRLAIVQSIAANGEQPCGTFNLPVAKSTLSHHFRVLRESGVIRMESRGKHIINSLRRKDLDGRFPGLIGSILRESRTR